VAPIAANELILTVARQISAGGNGFAALMGAVTTSNSATSFTYSATTGVAWSDFETAWHSTADRVTGLRIRVRSVERIITDSDNAGVLTVAPGFPFVPAVGDVIEIGSDLPDLVSNVTIWNPAAAAGNIVRYNTMDQAGLITAGQFMEIAPQSERTIIEDYSGFGTSAYRIRVAGSGSQAFNFTVTAP
jgi:hypothetical protein